MTKLPAGLVVVRLPGLVFFCIFLLVLPGGFVIAHPHHQYSAYGEDYGEPIGYQMDGCAVGGSDQLNETRNFNEKSSLMQIFDWMRPDCEGIVRSVTFFNHAPGDFKHFYFAVFEPINSRTDASRLGYRIVNYVKIEFNSSEARWITIQLPSNAGEMRKP